MIRVVNIYR